MGQVVWRGRCLLPSPKNWELLLLTSCHGGRREAAGKKTEKKKVLGEPFATVLNLPENQKLDFLRLSNASSSRPSAPPGARLSVLGRHVTPVREPREAKKKI